MTYCVAMCLSDGLVFASDSRTNAGVDHIATFKNCTFSIRMANASWSCSLRVTWPRLRA